MRLILTRKNATVDPAVEQPLANILWAAPFLTQDIPELGQVTAMFKRHFGPDYVSLCEQNKLGMVDVDLLRCLSCDLIPKLLIEKYLVEICRSQSVPFEPDPTIMAQDEFWAIGQRYVQPTPPVTTTTNDEKRPPPPPSGGASGGGGHIAKLESPAAPHVQPSAPMVSFIHCTSIRHRFDSVSQFEHTPPAYGNVRSVKFCCSSFFSCMN